MRVIVTGAASGIGAAVVRQSLALGAEVAALDLSPGDHLPDEAFFQPCDVSIDSDVENAVDHIVAKWNAAPTALVHCAGIYPQVPSVDIEAHSWDHTFAVNVRGSMLLARAVARRALESSTGASMVLLSSVAAERGDASEPAAAYAAGKGAIVSLVKQLAVEWGPHGIRINAVMPGVIDTPMTTVINDPEATREFLNTLPLRRLGTADDVARACLFLAGDDSSFITGTALPVDGGFLAS